jgi:hypothetical protein
LSFVLCLQPAAASRARGGLDGFLTGDTDTQVGFNSKAIWFGSHKTLFCNFAF